MKSLFWLDLRHFEVEVVLLRVFAVRPAHETQELQHQAIVPQSRAQPITL
jgi:hypothetical protein